MSEFEPTTIPMIYETDADVQLKKRIEADETNARIGTAALLLAKNITEEIDDTIRARIYINTQSPVIQGLGRASDGLFEVVTQILRSFMVALTGQSTLETGEGVAEEMAALSDQLNRLMASDTQRGAD